MEDVKKKPLRVAQIIGKMWAGGVETVVFNYYRQLNQQNVQFDFFYDADSTVEPPRDLIDMGARFYKLPPYQRLIPYILQLRKSLKENGYLIVHSHLNTLSIFPLFTAWIVGVPVRIAHNHSVPGGNEWKRNFVKNILRPFSKVFATDYFACSEKAGRWLFGDRTFESGKVNVVKNAVSFEKFNVEKSLKVELIRKYSLEGKTVVGHVGRFTFAKNHKKLIDIFKIIHDQNPNSVLFLVGDGELHDDIEKQIVCLGIKDDVVCVGKVPNPEIYYSLFDEVILPSIFEGFSMTTIEAQVSGIPIVMSKAIPEEAIISDGCIYMDVVASDVDWANQAMQLIGKSVKLNRKSEDFDIKKCAQFLEEWYLRVK